MSIQVGQVYASTHKGDIASGQRQRRVVERVDGQFVWLRTEDTRVTNRPQPLSRLRPQGSPVAQRIPGHRLVGYAPPRDLTEANIVLLPADTIECADAELVEPNPPRVSPESPALADAVLRARKRFLLAKQGLPRELEADRQAELAEIDRRIVGA